MLYLVDACYGGIAAVGSRGLVPNSTNSTNFIDKVAKFQSRQVITAGGRGEKVIEKPEWGHSAFTLNIKRGLKDGAADMNSDGYITANELGMFLSEKVTIDSGNQQTPQYGRMTSEEGEFIFVYNDLQLIETVTPEFIKTKYYKLLISKLSDEYMHDIYFPPIIAKDINRMIASAPKFIIKEPNIMDEKTTSEEIENWGNLMYILSEFENGASGDSIATYWNDKYYLKIFIE
tara:strand:+ start:4 stop:699 length:696 start_codon:yes stop_codon:yes gene_type:complete